MNVKIPCVHCSSGWMEPIEKAAAPILESIMRGEGFPPARDLFRLATWSTVLGRPRRRPTRSRGRTLTCATQSTTNV